MEVFLSPGRNDDYWHFVVNAAGRASIQRQRGGEISEIPGAEHRVTATGWAVKLDVPFRSVGGAPKPGAVWGMNLCRSKHTEPPETVTWQEVASTFHDPSSFGRLVFE